MPKVPHIRQRRTPRSAAIGGAIRGASPGGRKDHRLGMGSWNWPYNGVYITGLHKDNDNGKENGNYYSITGYI